MMVSRQSVKLSRLVRTVGLKERAGLQRVVLAILACDRNTARL